MQEEHSRQIRAVKIQYESRIRDLQLELETSYNKITKKDKEIIDFKKQTENYDHIQSMARTNREVLTKKDFSILETMSRRVEEYEQVNENLRSQVNNLSQTLSSLSLEKSKLEKNIYDFLKEEINLNRHQLEKIEINNDEYFEEVESYSIFKTQSNEILLDSIINQKKENIMIKQQLAELTIEINQMMRKGNF
jgi:hypothetical protein